MDALPLWRARFLINERKPAHNRAPPGSDRSFTVGHVSARPARDGRAPLLILRNSELSYEQRSGAINKKEELLEQGRVYQRIMFLSF